MGYATWKSGWVNIPLFEREQEDKYPVKFRGENFMFKQCVQCVWDSIRSFTSKVYAKLIQTWLRGASAYVILRRHKFRGIKRNFSIPVKQENFVTG